jgi:CRP-like cAMP-binding protein
MAQPATRRWPRLGRPAPLPVTPPAIAAKQAFLREHRIFAGLSSREQIWLNTSTTMVRYPQGRAFYHPNDRGEVIFILKEGRTNLYRMTPDGRKLVTAQLQPGTVFGEMALFGQGMYGCHAEAATDCLICVLGRGELVGLIQRDPVVALNLLEDLGQRLQTCESQLEAFAFGNVTSRLASFLLSEADAFGTVLGLSHQEIGERLGIYRETVSQTLGRFRQQGIIAVETRHIRLLDPDRLAVLARA